MYSLSNNKGSNLFFVQAPNLINPIYKFHIENTPMIANSNHTLLLFPSEKFDNSFSWSFNPQNHKKDGSSFLFSLISKSNDIINVKMEFGINTPDSVLIEEYLIQKFNSSNNVDFKQIALTRDQFSSEYDKIWHEVKYHLLSFFKKDENWEKIFGKQRLYTSPIIIMNDDYTESNSEFIAYSWLNKMNNQKYVSLLIATGNNHMYEYCKAISDDYNKVKFDLNFDLPLIKTADERIFGLY